MAGTGIAIGVPIHNGARYLEQALEALLAQSRGDFGIVLLDDGSVDGSESIAREYARRDRRIAFFRNDSRTGLVNAWTRVAELAGDAYAPRYFAWFSDHDWVAPDWLERLAEVLEECPGTVLAHARTVHVDADGSPTGTEGYALDTAKMGPYDRLRAVTLGTFGAGDAVYGLISFDALCRCGIFPREILPDRLLVSELALVGAIAHVPGAVRFRRAFPLRDPADLIRRQLSTLSVPIEQQRRPHLSHATYFIRRFLNAPAAEPPARRMQRLYHSLLYFQRQLNKYRTECVRELELPDPFGELAPVVDFLGAVLEGKWRFLYQDYASLAEKVRDAHAQVRRFKALRDDLQEQIAELRARNAEAETRIAMLTEELRHPLRHWIKAAVKVLRRMRLPPRQSPKTTGTT